MNNLNNFICTCGHKKEDHFAEIDWCSVYVPAPFGKAYEDNCKKFTPDTLEYMERVYNAQ